MRKKAAEDKDAAEDKKANCGTKCRSQGDKGRRRMGHGRQSGLKQATGILGYCSEARWFKGRSGMGPEKKARAVGRLETRMGHDMGVPHMKRGAEWKQEVVGIPEDHKG